MAARLVRPISAAEFSRMVESAQPPSGWSESLAVANSGGPDSTCLLFLFDRFLKGPKDGRHKKLPRRLISLSIDHGLQASSSSMAEHAAKIAQVLGIEHNTMMLPWGEGTNPPKPGPEDKIEEVARAMRHRAFFNNMIANKANALAMGHHIDDQVETMLMRLGRGAHSHGLAGMRPCRRWGMGSHEDSYGAEGLRRWIIRPLLRESKDRLLATCEENKLDYVNDLTNFQPQLTVRNAIRHIIKEGGTAATTASDPDLAKFPPEIAKQLAEINVAAAEDPALDFNLASSVEYLREANQNMILERYRLEGEVDRIIEDGRLQSPQGTFMVSVSTLMEIKSQDVKEALLYRIARYVSPEPWGNPRAELGRREASMERLIKQLFAFKHLKAKNNISIVVGSGVWWKLVSLAKNQLRTAIKELPLTSMAWIAVRQPRTADREDRPHNPLRVDLSDRLKEAIPRLGHQKPPHTVLEVMYDCRFLMCFRIDKIPEDIVETLNNGGKLIVKPRTAFLLPQILLVHRKKDKVVHSDIIKKPYFFPRDMGWKKDRTVTSDWITVEYFRPSTAI
ncbi:hypothetical protein NLJ89_g6272 [Agrocybe chaxingu]|uniref:tRNA(Ile)-lysidine synthetase n=1 Tax=Agrocybe chaxingu TaxID=84603 RepID=A0A9W8K5W4_9AGAR|nr:hypothetical protein NLJ89_g6272 [Agrocybe chaxingu]